MRVLDTNVLVRLFVRDDPGQVEIAERVLEESFLVLPTVLIELVWVLMSRYTMPRTVIAKKLEEFLGLDLAIIVSETSISWALDRYRLGADFADMLHIALGNELEAHTFATFDRRIKPGQVEGLAIALEPLG